MSDRQASFSGTGAVRAGAAFDEAALDRWLAANVAGYAGPLSVSQFKGGQSNPTYRLDTPGRAYVMRRKPSGPILKGAHAVEREYRVIAALHARGFPVARPYALCVDDAVIGTWFYVMEMVEGRIFWDSSLPGLAAADRPAHFDAMNATIAQLHGIDPAAAGLADYGAQGDYFARQIARWTRQYLGDAEAGRDPHMDRLVEWLPAHIPAGADAADADAVRIVHGDFRADNMVFHPDEPRVIAVLDWELSTLGHPLADFAYHLMMYRMPAAGLGGFAGMDLVAANIPDEAAYIDAYCRRTGRTGIPDLGFYMAFNLFRLAGIVHGIRGRIARGNAASAHAVATAERFPALAALGWAQTAGA